MRPRLVALLTAALAVGGLSACERADEQAADTGSTTLTIYTSLGFQGAGGPDATAVANGVRLALRQAGGKVGDLVVKLVVLDDSTPKAGRWDPEQTADNARQAARDRTAIGYIGDGTSGATAISLPILNSAGIAQVSPTSTYSGLTSTQDADKGEPEKYYPSGQQTFARPVPTDAVQVRALLSALREARCTRLEVLEDRDLSGHGLGTAVEDAAPAAGVKLVGRQVVLKDDDPADVAAKVVKRGAGCALYTGALADWVPPLFDAVHAAAPTLELFGGDAVASESLAAALAPATQGRMRLAGPPGVLEPRPAVRLFARRYEEAFGVPARSGALYGYESAQLLLRAMRSAGARGNNRDAVARAIFSAAERPSLLGRYRIGRGGDTSSTAYSLFGVRGGRLARLRTARFPG